MKKILFSIFLINTILFADTPESEVNITAISMFLIFVASTLTITLVAAKKTRTAKDFYTAGGGITGMQNGLAMAGDYMSAASFLGISGLIYFKGYDGLVYSIGFLVGWPILLFLISEQLKNLGKYTFADVASYRLKQNSIRTVAACGSLATIIFYLIAQMVGSGKLIQVLFGIPYSLSIILVGTIMTLLVAFGGMLATTWVQIIKAILLLFGTTILTLLVMSHFDFNLNKLFEKAVQVRGSDDIMSPGQLLTDPISAISLGIALMFGTAGLPHILMRFFTVSDAKTARKSVFFATGFIGYFFILIFVIGYGAIALISSDPTYLDAGKSTLIGGDNMAAIHLSHAAGGNIFLGFISAVAFATILAVVSGLTISGASSIAHDLYTVVIKKGNLNESEQMKISKYATFGLGVMAIILGIIFEEQNIAYMVGLAFAIAASANFPIIFLSIFWKGLTTRGAMVGSLCGLFSAIVLMLLSPTVWVDVFGNEEAIFPYKYPALFSVTISFLATWLFSITDKSTSAKQEKELFDDQYIRAQTGIGATKFIDRF